MTQDAIRALARYIAARKETLRLNSAVTVHGSECGCAPCEEYNAASALLEHIGEPESPALNAPIQLPMDWKDGEEKPS